MSKTKEKDNGLNERQELFCQLYATSLDHLGNGVHAYSEAFGINLNEKGKYQSAKVSASRLLTKDNILKRIRDLGDDILNDASIDKELSFVALQRAELGPKMKAISEYNKIKGRIIDKMEGELKGEIVVKVNL